MDSILDLALTAEDNYLSYHVGLCQLHGRGHVCRGGMTVQHIVNKSKTQRSKAKRKASENPKLLAIVCLAANSDTKIADTKWARQVLLYRKIEKYGYEVMKELVKAAGGRLDTSGVASF